MRYCFSERILSRVEGKKSVCRLDMAGEIYQEACSIKFWKVGSKRKAWPGTDSIRTIIWPSKPKWKKNENEPRHEKTNVLFCICKNKGADQLRGSREADQGLCFRYIDRTIPLISKSRIASLWPSSVAVQLGLCRNRSETRMLVFS